MAHFIRHAIQVTMPSANNDPTESEKEDDKEEVEADVDVSEDKAKEEDDEETQGIDIFADIS